jgi:hypothetical protein
MLKFDKFIERHSESAAQAIIERLERYENIRSPIGASLEDRWNALMQDAPFTQDRLAA